MTGVPTDFNYGIRAGKTFNFPIVSQPLALFFVPPGSAISIVPTHRFARPPSTLSRHPPPPPPPFLTVRDRFPLDYRKISANVELWIGSVRRLVNETLAIPSPFFPLFIWCACVRHSCSATTKCRRGASLITIILSYYNYIIVSYRRDFH